jgi:hypothetical protein
MSATRECSGLEWVRVGDRRAHVSEFAHLRPGARPAVSCPECNDRVILALGKVRRHHARHREGAVCVATQPETALHLNTKYYLADVLTRAAGTGESLRLRRGCIVGNRPYLTGGEVTWTESTSDGCSGFDDAVLVGAWDTVRVESRVSDRDGYRTADIVLLDGGRCVGAIEVLASHAVDADKAAMFARLDVPWVEVEASEELIDPATGWTIAQPLDPHASSVPLAWRCEAHQVSAPRESTRRMAVSERAPERSTLRAGRIVDVYLPNGTWRRLAYRVRAAYAAGALVRLALDRNGQLVRRYPAPAGETEAAFLSRMGPVIRRDCDADVASLSRKAVLVDAGRWLKDDALRLLDDVSRIRRQYRFNSADHQWERDASDARQAALQKIESAVRGRRSPVQQSLEPTDD